MKIPFSGFGMRHAVRIICVYGLLLLSSISYAQPYVYYVPERPESVPSKTYQNDTVYRYDIKTGRKLKFLVCNSQGIFAECDPTGLYMALDVDDAAVIYETSNKKKHFDSDNLGDCDKLLYSPEKNRLYIFSLCRIGEFLSSYNVKNGKCESSIQLPYQDGYRNQVNREAFFSRDKSIIYFQEPDTTTKYFESNKEKLVRYSTRTNKVYKKQRLSKIFHPRAMEYYLFSGADGVGVVISIMDSLQTDCYYTIYDFDNSRQLGEIHCSGNPDPYIIGDNKYLALFSTDADTLSGGEFAVNYLTGRVLLYDVKSGTLVKKLHLPSRGTVYRFDNYPDTLYYVKNLTGIPQVLTIDESDIIGTKE
jgi:hypothetical protein